MDIIVNSLGWHPPAGERIVSLCHMRDEIIMATDNGLYVIRYELSTNDYHVEETKPESNSSDRCPECKKYRKSFHARCGKCQNIF